MITSILTERQEELRAALCGLLGELVRVLEALGEGDERERVAAGLEALDGLFRMGVAGGPGTAVEEVVAALVPAPVARLSVVSVPAGQPVRWEGGVDVGLFVTSAARALPPAEHGLLVAASDGAGALFVVVDGVEMLRLSEDVLRMEAAVATSAERVLGFQPQGAGVSTSLAAASPAPKESLVPALARRIVAVLRSPAVVRPKLLAPLEVALGVAEARRAAVADELAALADDLANLEVVEAELGRFDRQAEAALREAEATAAEAVAAFGERAGAFVRRRTRPFPLRFGRRRLEERFEEEAVDGLAERLQGAAGRLDERLRRAAAAGRAAVTERLASVPTPLGRRHAPEKTVEASRGAPSSGGAAGPATSALADLRPRPLAKGLVAALRRSRASSLVLLVLGLLLVPGGVLWGVMPAGPLPAAVVLWGLAGIAVLAAAAALGLTRQRLTARLAGELEGLRAAAAAAVAAGAERAAHDGRSEIRAVVAAYAPAVLARRDRLAPSGETLARLTGELGRLREGIERL